ncbi:MAG: aspartate aminotransferase family protein [Ilumatobacteraceae bacterium]|jgi:glutamate-1-semialdehyde 2,1-aminomutase|nr:aspartate aminotransferase family protein [Acidimicrobiaceae bacterium]MBP6487718.1 aspartate aminotransferase family protein [Ilumatobacteraceae bacterium]MBK9971283.1 aspartate aminotransferase family protein [Acidimicrobiaceae bacterium]MBP7887745.1 aspartate aminotransferase family protein [Ilumatobacteraceae bacterium]MBP8209624.1 aspartate aminotransferase family protein [Ilumatobacteraceae bacterium]
MGFATDVSLDDLIRREEEIFLRRMPKTAELWERAQRSMPGGVSSSWASSRPLPVWVSHGEGAYVWDADGTRYADMHGGYGVNVVGHANPAVVRAVQQRVARGTHFAQPTEDSIYVAEALAQRFGLPMWRFGNSGTEVTMDAFHLMRAITGRSLVVKIEGTYHGHHDSAMVSIFRAADQLGPLHDPHRVPGPGVAQEMADLLRIVPFNDLPALERVLDQHSGQIAGMIVEPMMMNAGIIPPQPGYLEGVRELTRRYGVLLAFDEVKTGLVVDWGGATRLFGVTPDIVCLAKALGGGLPCGAIGGTEEVMAAITDGRYDQIGTFNGNPLTMAAARATLLEVLTPDVYGSAEALGRRMLQGSMSALAAHGQPSYGNVFGFKGSVVFHDRAATSYREFLAISTAVSHLHFLVQFNNGIFLPPWGKSESWTLSVAHTDIDGDLYVANVNRLAEMVAGLGDRASDLFAAGSFN